jgi:hypothetical protein
VQTPVPGQGEEEDADRDQGKREQSEGSDNWLTVTEAARASGCHRGQIHRPAPSKPSGWPSGRW